MEKTNQTQPAQAQESENAPLPDFRTGWKDEQGNREKDALPPTNVESDGSEGETRIAVTMASEDKVIEKVQKANLVMDHCYSAAVQLMNSKLGSSSLIMGEGPGAAPPGAALQLAMPMAQAMFNKVYTNELEEIIEFEEVPVKPKDE